MHTFYHLSPPVCRHDIMEAINQQQKVLLTLEKSVRELKDGLQHSIHTDRGISKRGGRRISAPPTD